MDTEDDALLPDLELNTTINQTSCHEESSMFTIISYVIGNITFLSCLTLLPLFFDNNKILNSSDAIIFSLSFMYTLVCIIRDPCGVIRRFMRTKRRIILLNLLIGIFNAGSLVSLVYSSLSENASFYVHAILIFGYHIGYSITTHICKFENISALERILAVCIFIMIGSVLVYDIVVHKYSSYFQLIYFTAHLLYGVASAIMELIWLKNRVDMLVHEFQISCAQLIIIIVILSLVHRADYSGLWDGFYLVYQANIHALIIIILMVSYLLSALLEKSIHAKRKSSKHHIWETIIPLGVFIVSISTYNLHKSKVIKQDIIILGIFVLAITILSVFKIHQIILRHRNYHLLLV